ncbi:MAG: arginine--tRNA ligase [Saccharofermentans sp.]|jgi:arginyl-tRNA synthetase|nr:arginine--tRNA ligase [Mageeibacillus sp.]MCI1263689.1 arginine--tRNA ligase [Saccharofermentans sp.]MCI1275330.1 arginine--tRNA ligase [Saccharofermentans sp.]MCI1769850.1 arginine--tRNA ligase [Mageeibacillus sp.]MCI2043701.1 arginine--tRNA ligase [Mageeibacillus sp.]
MDYKERIASNIAKITGLEQAKVSDLIEIPPQMSLGDYAFPCFVLAKTMHKAPAAIAQELCDNHELTDGAVTAKNAGPYVNFFIDRKVLAEEVLTEIILKGSRYGEENIGEGRNVIVEFSSPNIAKPFHVGHAFTTILGNSISAIYGKLGYNVVRFNHLGDYGTQFGKLITAYRLWGDEEALGKAPIDELLRIYVRFHEEAEKDPSLEDAARENFRKLEEGCSDEVALWERFRKLSLEVFEKTYNRMGVKFDNYNGESFYSSRIPAVVDMLREKGLLEESEGAQVVKLDDEGLPPCIILKSDGTTIYASRDLAAVLYRYENYHFDKNIYVVGLPQQLHFKQVFAVLRKAGYKCADDCVHVGFGLVKFKNNTAFSTRKGNIVLLDDLLNKTVEKTAEIIKTNAAARGDDMSADEIAEIAEKIGIGAVKYTYLKSGREKDILFDWDEMLDFEGDTAPYLIYTYARTRSILRKADSLGLDIASGSGLGLLTGDDEYAVIRNLADYKDSIRKAAASYEPFMVSRQIAVIARSYNRFYNNSSILSADSTEQKKARLALCSCVCEVLRSGLELLGINVVEKM